MTGRRIPHTELGTTARRALREQLHRTLLTHGLDYFGLHSDLVGDLVEVAAGWADENGDRVLQAMLDQTTGGTP